MTHEPDQTEQTEVRCVLMRGGTSKALFFHEADIPPPGPARDRLLKRAMGTPDVKLGSAPEKPASGNVMLRIAPEVHAAALKAAARSGTSLNKWAEGALGKAAGKPLTRSGLAPDPARRPTAPRS